MNNARHLQAAIRLMFLLLGVSLFALRMSLDWQFITRREVADTLVGCAFVALGGQCIFITEGPSGRNRPRFGLPTGPLAALLFAVLACAILFNAYFAYQSMRSREVPPAASVTPS